MNSFLIGLSGGLLGGLSMVALNYSIYLYTLHQRKKEFKEIQDLFTAMESEKRSENNAKVLQFKAPNPPTKMN